MIPPSALVPPVDQPGVIHFDLSDPKKGDETVYGFWNGKGVVPLEERIAGLQLDPAHPMRTEIALHILLGIRADTGCARHQDRTAFAWQGLAARQLLEGSNQGQPADTFLPLWVREWA